MMRSSQRLYRCAVILAGFIILAAVNPIVSSSDESSDMVKSASAAVNSTTPAVVFGSTKISGTFHSTYQYRNFDNHDDNDLYEYLSLRMDDLVKDRVDGAFSMMWHGDLDRYSSSSDWYDPFMDSDQARGNHFKFFTGYVDIKKIGFEDSKLRLGRQYLEEIDHVHFDGASYHFSPHSAWDITLFGGRPVTYYSSTDGNAVYGADVRYQVNKNLKTAVRYYRYDTNHFEDDMGAVEVWYRFTPEIMSHSEFSLLNGDPYIFQKDVYARIDCIDLDINAQFIRLFEKIGDQTINFNPYFAMQYSYEPFTYGSLTLTKGMGKYWSLIGGFDVREADGIHNVLLSGTNKDYLRFTAGAELYPTDKLTLSVNGEFWDVSPGEDQFTGITGEIEYRPDKHWTLSSGVDYGEYIQEFRDEFLFLYGDKNVFRISPDVMTYYGRIRWKPTEKIFTSARFEVEDNDTDHENWYSVRLEVGVNF